MISTSEQPLTLIDRLDAAVDRCVTQGNKPAAIYLTPSDYRQFAREHTRVYRAATGSTALLWPTSHDAVPLVSEQLAERLQIPVRQQRERKSAVYASTGERYPLL